MPDDASRDVFNGSERPGTNVHVLSLDEPVTRRSVHQKWGTYAFVILQLVKINKKKKVKRRLFLMAGTISICMIAFAVAVAAVEE